MSNAFRGFRPEALGFLVERALNDARCWFGRRKAEYRALLKGPLEQRCAALLVLAALKLQNSGILKTVAAALGHANPLLRDFALRSRRGNSLPIAVEDRQRN